MNKLFVLALFIYLGFSCKKNSDNPFDSGCPIDSISLYNNWTYPLSVADVYKFKYENGKPSEIRVYYRSLLRGVQKLFFDSNNRLISKEFFTPTGSTPGGKNIYFYNKDQLFIKLTNYGANSSNPTQFYKISELNLSYINNTPSAVKFSWFNLNDSINPAATYSVPFTGKNGNVEKAEPNNGGSQIFFKIQNTENLLRKNYRFLIDPVFDFHAFYSERYHLLPVLLNVNTTTTVFDGVNSAFFDIRGAYNQNRQPESFSSTMATWDYVYKNCN